MDLKQNSSFYYSAINFLFRYKFWIPKKNRWFLHNFLL